MNSSGKTVRIWRDLSILAIVLLCSFFNGPATAQSLQTRKGENLSALGKVNQQLAVSEKKKAELRREIALLAQDRARISQALIDAAKRTRQLEIRLGEIESRIAVLGEQETAIKQSLHERRYLLSQVLAALQRMGRNPPPALLVRPEDALASVRSAVLLGAVVPEMRAETDILIADLRELARLRNDITNERQQHAISIKSLAEDDIRLSLLVDEKSKLQGTTRKALKNQNKQARNLAQKATSLKQLITSLNAQINDAELAARIAQKADEARQQADDKRLSVARSRINGDKARKSADLASIKPRVSFEEAKGRLQLPVAGVEVLSFGQKNTTGTRAKGALMATRANALVISPLDAKVVYAGPFRSYGQLLILDAGNHVHIVMAGMSRISVGAGQIVLAGEPVAKMGSTRIASLAAVDIASSRPMLYVEFRKGGKSFDPTPWWAENSMKRPRNDS